MAPAVDAGGGEGPCTAMLEEDGLGILGRICPPEGPGEDRAGPSGAPRMLEVGETMGYWFDVDEDVFCSAGVLAKDALGRRTGFPRSWPECYSTSKPLRRLVGKRGLAGVRTGVVDALASEAEWHAAAPFLRRHGRESSFVTALRVARERPGWEVVKGFVVYELVDAPAGEQFVAHRHWYVRGRPPARAAATEKSRARAPRMRRPAPARSPAGGADG